jgi:hypothetical protein
MFKVDLASEEQEKEISESPGVFVSFALFLQIDPSVSSLLSISEY